jgi:hypothetical protein
MLILSFLWRMLAKRGMAGEARNGWRSEECNERGMGES